MQKIMVMNPTFSSIPSQFTTRRVCDLGVGSHVLKLTSLRPFTQASGPGLPMLPQGTDFTFVLHCLNEACRALKEWEGSDMVTSLDFKEHNAAANQIILQVEKESACAWVTKQTTLIFALSTECLQKRHLESRFHMWVSHLPVGERHRPDLLVCAGLEGKPVVN